MLCRVGSEPERAFELTISSWRRELVKHGMHRLISLSFSHYNEKARWALDRFAVPYREERYLPFFCSMAVVVATRGRGGAADRTSSRYSTPVLITENGRVLTDSSVIA